MPEKSILIIEDEPDIIMLVKRSLKPYHFRILEANSGTNALSILENEKPDLILLDIMMPDMDGFEVCRRIKKDFGLKSIPVIFLTVRNNQDDMERGRRAGAVGYFTKPFDPFQLSEEINKFLN